MNRLESRIAKLETSLGSGDEEVVITWANGETTAILGRDADRIVMEAQGRALPVVHEPDAMTPD